MNDRTNRSASMARLQDADDGAPPPRDELDTLLRDWHRENADIAAANRERILAAVADERRPAPSLPRRSVIARIGHAAGPTFLRVVRSRTLRAAACIALAALLATIVLMPSRQPANASVLNVAEGGELTAFSDDGDRLGPCALEHTAVAAEVSGPVTRVTVRQRFANPYARTIEASYTFPLSHRAAVDSMRIVVRGADGVERVVDGEVRERGVARHIYEEARNQGYVASLLEQERPNVFTQSVANIEPGASVTVEIGYVEFLERVDGEYRFHFPMVVAPRYVPGVASGAVDRLPDGLVRRAGVVLLGPAEVTAIAPPNASASGALALQSAIASATPIRTPSPEMSKSLGSPTQFVATYANGSKETGLLFAERGIGEVNGRWFFVGGQRGGGFAQDTTDVPDASRVTPMPVRPSERAGHDVSMTVTIDAGGLPLSDLRSELHEITTGTGPRPNSKVVSLTAKTAIPNRDFLLSWRTNGRDSLGAEQIAGGILSHRRAASDETAGGYVAFVLEPPARAAEAERLDREFVFVVDVSGSMNGFPIEKSKELMARAIDMMRPNDRFNVITFAGGSRQLWQEPLAATAERKAEARAFVESHGGSGGTEMLPALAQALGAAPIAGHITPSALADLPADGRAVRVAAGPGSFDADRALLTLPNGSALKLVLGVQVPAMAGTRTLLLDGRWSTQSGERVLIVDAARFERDGGGAQRVVVFLSDGLVGNEGAILDLVRTNARSTRVFALGIGNSVNRYLIDGIARAGRGAAEFVTLQADADQAIDRLAKRLGAPVLADISIEFDGVDVRDLVPPIDQVPDLLDERPIVLVGRFGRSSVGTVTVRGRTASGPWERSMSIDLAGATEANSAVASLWARSTVDALVSPNAAALAEGSAPAALRESIVRLGERYGILTPLTSFVAVERSRVTVGGLPMLVRIPIELPEGMSWAGLFGDGAVPASWASRPDPMDPGVTRRRIAAVARLADRVVHETTARDGPGGVDKAEDATISLFFGQAEAPASHDAFGAVDPGAADSRSDPRPAKRPPLEPAAPSAPPAPAPAPAAAPASVAPPSPITAAPAGSTGLPAESLSRGESKAPERRARTTGGLPNGGAGSPLGDAAPSVGGGGGGFGGGQPVLRNLADELSSASHNGTRGVREYSSEALAQQAARQLERPMTLHFDNAAFGDVVRTLSDLTQTPIYLDWNELALRSIEPSNRVQLSVQNLSAKEVLQMALEQLGAPSEASPRFAIEPGVLVVSAPPVGESGAADTAAGTGGGSDASSVTGKRQGAAPKVVPGSAIGRSVPAAENAPARDLPAPQPGAKPGSASPPKPTPEPMPADEAKDSVAKPAEAPELDRAVKVEESRSDAVTGRLQARGADAPLTAVDRDRLARRLDRELIVLGLSARIDPAAAADLAAATSPPTPVDDEGRVLVTILLDGSDATTLRGLRDRIAAEGVALEGHSDTTRLVVARVALKDLLRIALLDGIRRIEPVRAAVEAHR